MTPRQLGTEVENAFDYRDREQHTRMLARLVADAATAQVTLAAVTGRNLAGLDRHQLEARRNELHVQLAAVNDHLQRIGATRNGDLAAGRVRGDCEASLTWCESARTSAASSLEPSDPQL